MIALAASVSLLFMSGGADKLGQPRVLAETPAGVSFECIGCKVTPDDIAKAAQAHCRTFGKKAELTYLAAEPSGDTRTAFKCI